MFGFSTGCGLVAKSVRIFPLVLVVLSALPAAAQTAITEIVPADGSSGVAVPVPIVITFNTAMDPTSLTTQPAFGACSGSIQLSRDNFVSCIAMLGTVAMSNGDTIATVTPAPAMAFGTNYKVRVLGSVRSAVNVPMGTDFTQTPGFLTGTDSPRPTHVMISQVYGGGGNTGAPYDHDFVELHNPQSVTVSLTGYALQNGSATGSTWTVNALPATAIAPGGYYLVQLGSGGGAGVPLPPPHFVPASPLQLASTAGKVALTNTATQLVGTCPVSGTIVDLVGYGTANCSEAMPTASASNTMAALRASCRDTDNNAADFTIGAPNPRNTAAPAEACRDATVNETGSALEINYCNLQFPLSISISAGSTSPLIYAQVYHAGYTEAAGASSIYAQIGYGPASVNPQNQPGYVWFTATFNVQSGNNDEYQASFTAATAGSYRYGARFSIDGANWTYCDIDGAGSNASLDFSPALLGVMTVTSRKVRAQVTSVD